MKRVRVGQLFTTLLLGTIALSPPSRLCAQEARGTITGTVVDSRTQRRPTYRIPGTYRVTVELTGFKTFFTYGYETIPEARPRNNGTPSVPTEKMRSGDFSELFALGSQYQLYNPFTARLNANGQAGFGSIVASTQENYPRRVQAMVKLIF